ncbi:MAG: hypothetical protein R3D84_18565 [Paracoccaceae bacterium]
MDLRNLVFGLGLVALVAACAPKPAEPVAADPVTTEPVFTGKYN